PSAEVSLVEPNVEYVSCPFSNLVISGLRDLSAQTFRYEALSREGIRIVRAMATDVAATLSTVTLSTGDKLPFDRLVMSPGISFRWDALEGYGESAAKVMPHAWKAGSQTELLQQQLRAMPDGGVVLISVPPAPFRCPPGPYERASLIAHYLKREKPRSKLILLDSNARFSKQPLFTDAWQTHYSTMVEWRGASDFGGVTRVDAGTMQLHTDFDVERGDVINVIPPQQAGEIAQRAGVADATGWCPVNAISFESRLVPGIHVVGDATIAAPMPKSAFAANQQAKVCAIQVARMLSDLAPQATTLANTCYSYTTAETAISVSGVYRSDDGNFQNVSGAGGMSPADDQSGLAAREAIQAVDWFSAITRETFG
ncbi:MAG: FCSD flavin-binding domain-containing protein, partial [Pseudomonadota bacterium]|nr:FCSD flavin-binding domain-containing protein [Pseudomonadota bacterium]